MRNRLKGFTLIEVIVTLILSCIVIVMAGYGFNMVKSTFHNTTSEMLGVESVYMVMADVEYLFNAETKATYRFNEVKFSQTSYDFGVEYTVRKQFSRLDTFSSFITRPEFGSTVNRQSMVAVDSLRFRFQDTDLVLLKSGSLADYIKTRIEYGQD